MCNYKWMIVRLLVRLNLIALINSHITHTHYNKYFGRELCVNGFAPADLIKLIN